MMIDGQILDCPASATTVWWKLLYLKKEAIGPTKEIIAFVKFQTCKTLNCITLEFLDKRDSRCMFLWYSFLIRLRKLS